MKCCLKFTAAILKCLKTSLKENSYPVTVCRLYFSKRRVSKRPCWGRSLDYIWFKIWRLWQYFMGRKTKKIYQSMLKKRPLLGIFLGHQIIAEALGGHATKFQNGWCVGVDNYQIKQELNWLKCETHYSGYTMHQD